MPLKISYKEFRERLRTGPQQFRAWELRELKDGVLLDGRDFDFRTVGEGWIFGHVPPTGESDWIDSEKIYDVLKAEDRIMEPGSPAAPITGAGSISPKPGTKLQASRGPQRPHAHIGQGNTGSQTQDRALGSKAKDTWQITREREQKVGSNEAGQD